ncbi:MAG TPA: hypothetical protein VFJ82_04985 [Longimicrobium sp.]|nr:hypothetical protein [Longimicrobium sp.]
MKKLLLRADDLCVETFATAEHVAGRGTVAGAAAWVVAGETAKPDCDLSGPPSCGYSFCGDETCGTCDDNTYCGYSCVLVCDGQVVGSGNV